ncbi:MAG: iron-sulfur cluster assembly protein [Bacteroidales bacterium]|nr:iron-sulfur cluster assembly protein [Bacteroidales bacterium]
MKAKVIEVLSSIYDPEIPVNIWELGFIYKLEVNESNDVYILMTLTAPNCPVAESLPMEVQTRVSMIPGVNKVTVDVTFDPPWEMDMMSEAAKLELDLLY